MLLHKLTVGQSKTYYIAQDDVIFVRGRKGGWKVYGVCDLEGVPDEPLTLFLAISSIHEKPQSNWIFVEIPEPHSPDEEVFEP